MEEATSDPPLLAAHQLTTFTFAAGQTRSVSLAASAAGHAELLIESSAPGTEFVVFAPDHEPVKSAVAQYPGWVAITFAVAGQARYTLLARAKPPFDSERFAFRADLEPSLPNSAEAHAKAGEIFASAQTLSHSATATDVKQAIALYKKAAALWESVHDRDGLVLTLAGEGQAWLELSQCDNATEALARAAAIVPSSPHWRAWLADLQAQIYLDRWEFLPARKSSDEALRLNQSVGDEWLAAGALADLAESEYITHNPAAFLHMAQALQLARNVGAVKIMARVMRCQAWLAKDEGQMSRAFSMVDQARDNFQKAGDIRDELQAMSTLAAIENISGNLYATLLRHTQISAMIRDTGYERDYGIVLDNIGADYERLNRIPDAILYYRKALAVYESIHDASGELMAHLNLCSAELADKQLTDSLRNCSAAAAIAKRFHDPWKGGDISWQLGKLQRELGQTGNAIASFRSAVELCESKHNIRFEAGALIDWGDMLESLGRYEEARALFEKALPLSQAAEDVPGQVEAHFRIALSLFKAGRDDQAKRELRIALESIDDLRRSVGNADLQAAYFAQVHKCHNLYVEILMSENGAAAEALEISESGRALTLLDKLAAREQRLEISQQSSATQELSELHSAVERAYGQRLKLMLEGGHKRDLEANSAELTEAIDALERAEDAQKAYAASSPEPSGRTLPAAEIAAASRSLHSTLIEYELGIEHSYAWVIENGKIESYILPPQDRIEASVRKWRELATARSQFGENIDDHRRRVDAADRELPRVAANLSCMLLAPFLTPKMDHLVIVPDGDLDLLPFAALPDTGCQGGGQPIAAQHQVVLTPSLSVLLASHPPAPTGPWGGDVAILADPVFDGEDPRVHRTADSPASGSLAAFAPALPRLLGTREEAWAISAVAERGRAALYLDFNASLQTLFSPSLSSYRILHLATHGVLDESAPGFSGVILSQVDKSGQPVFGYLKTQDVADLDLHFDLVVLSSCDSAAGVNLSGEGVTGLNRAFLSAGARRVVSTLWSVDDDASKQFMTAFYTAMLRDGLYPPEALQRSQLQIMRNPRTAAPYYWAGFAITSVAE